MILGNIPYRKRSDRTPQSTLRDDFHDPFICAWYPVASLLVL
jgi:hypothetical protein